MSWPSGVSSSGPMFGGMGGGGTMGAGGVNTGWWYGGPGGDARGQGGGGSGGQGFGAAVYNGTYTAGSVGGSGSPGVVIIEY
ncbi:hypothetical protein [Comamonas testosteroni]|uniref:hypothetical protein n=1 Tax=Comamonas testosteroni TaxID=285 RepID=UPI00159E8D96|nr:hypothetical protein [Comamonas testosteroni]